MSVPSPRLLTFEAMALLPLARILVKWIRMKHWRGTLGRIADTAIVSRDEARNDNYRVAARIARHVERGAGWLPFETKCLPRAMVLQWMLRRRSIGSTLIIARSLQRRDCDEWHAWVESSGEILIGHCERRDYKPLLTIISGTLSGTAQQD